MIDLDERDRSMSARDLERWLIDATDALVELGVRGVHGRGPNLGHGGPASWVSFGSDHGSGRIVRHDDGSCVVDARRHADGRVLVDRWYPATTTVEIAEVVNAISPPVTTVGD